MACFTFPPSKLTKILCLACLRDEKWRDEGRTEELDLLNQQ